MNAPQSARRIPAWACVPVWLVFGCGLSFAAEAMRYDGVFALATNGDLSVTLKFTFPMENYQTMREDVSNLYLMMREFSPNRASEETVEQKADWDDANRGVLLSMKVLGGARNMGSHWELEVPKEFEFSNLDESKKIMYFNESGTAFMGNVQGLSKLVFPPESSQIKWESSRRVASYVLPQPGSAFRGSALWIPAILLLAIGALMIGGSFLVKPTAAASPAPVSQDHPPTPPQ